MDMISAASVFATIVSLLAEFKSQRHDASADDINEFSSWLQEKQHEEMLDLLRQNSSTLISIKALLTLDRKDFAEKLQKLDDSLAMFAGGVDGFSQLSNALRPDAMFSEQAISILRQYRDAGASAAIAINSISSPGPILLFTDGMQGQVKYQELQFINDDLDSLVDAGLLRLNFNSAGNNMYRYTRAAAKYLSGVE